MRRGRRRYTGFGSSLTSTNDPDTVVLGSGAAALTGAVRVRVSAAPAKAATVVRIHVDLMACPFPASHRPLWAACRTDAGGGAFQMSVSDPLRGLSSGC